MEKIDIRYTTIHHQPRVALGLTLMEYAVAASIYTLSHNPAAPVTGWCSASKKKLSEFIGVTDRTIFNIVSKLEQEGIVERHGVTSHLRTTKKWYDAVERFTGYEKFAHPMKNNDSDHEKSSQEAMKDFHRGYEDVSYNNNTYKDKDKDTPLTPQGEQGALFSSMAEETVTVTRPGTEENQAPQKESAEDQYRKLIEWMSIATGKKFRGDASSRRAFNARLKDGYTMDDFRLAIKAAYADRFHKENHFKYLTPEYITRPAQLEKWLNTAPSTPQAQENMREQKAKKAGIQY